MTESNRSEGNEIDAVLARASRPAVPLGAVERMLSGLPARSGAATLVPLARPKRPTAVPWPAFAALAASFALGIYLGAMGAGDLLWPVESVDAASAVGLGEAEAYLGEDGQ